MQADPKVIKSLNDCLYAEITFGEVSHAWEKVAKRYGFKGLGRILDSINDDSRDRRRRLEKRLCRCDAPMAIAMKATTVDPRASWDAVLADAERMARDLAAGYSAARKVAGGAGDEDTGEVLCGLVEDANDLIARLEGYARQIADVTLPQWLAEQLRGPLRPGRGRQ